MVKIQKAPHPKDIISGKELGSYMNAKSDYGAHLPRYVQVLLWAESALYNMQVHENDPAITMVAAKMSIAQAREYLDEVEELMLVEESKGIAQY